jgi:hypothetical protein
MKNSLRKKPVSVIYDINARCLDLEAFSGFFSRRKRNRLYESAMTEISDRVLDLFEEVETISFSLTSDGFHILIWSVRDNNRISRVMGYVQNRFAETVNRHLDRTGPVWDGRWSFEVLPEPDAE